ncbi:enkurin domain-containing protein 1-like [Babylonia areolata]|uniref:enkurin domain-containing protein 1-like n=1 Tax=Babylonia areolata TaxID=304850 RepID=UPI003FD10234
MQGGLMLEGTGFGSSRQIKDFRMKDHVAENVRRMRQIQRRCRQREKESVQPVKVLWKSEKYTEVQSRIKQDLENPATPRPSSATFLRAHSRSGPPVKLESRPCTPDPSEKLSVPLASSANDVKMVRHNFDFIKINGRNARHATMPRAASVTALDELKKKEEEAMTNYTKGDVPVYLRNRKKQWRKDEEERIANTPDPAMPPGHRALPESERRETLSLLQQKEKELVQQLSALPIGSDTVRVRNLRKGVESKLAEVEEAIKIFSRPKVFVKVDPQ